MRKEILHSKIFEKQNTVPLLIFHGLFGMLDNWATIGKRFSEEREVHLIDLRNHGRSFRSEVMDYQSMSEDIINYMDFYNIPKAILLGHSLGGKAVMECAIKHPDKVEKLIVVDMAPKAYPPHHQSIFKALESVDFSQIHDRKDIEKILSQYVKEPGVIQFLLKNVYRTDNHKFDFRFNLKVLSSNYNGLINNTISLGKYEKPSLFIAGEKSNYILPQDEFYIRQQFTEQKIVIISKAGHWVQADNPAEFYEVVHKFLND